MRRKIGGIGDDAFYMDSDGYRMLSLHFKKGDVGYRIVFLREGGLSSDQAMAKAKALALAVFEKQ